MKLRPSCLLLLFFTVFLTPNLRADDAKIIAAVHAADDERVAATIAADPKRLDAIFSDRARAPLDHPIGRFPLGHLFLPTVAP